MCIIGGCSDAEDGPPASTVRVSNTWHMSSFISLVVYAGITILLVMAAAIVVVAIIGVVVAVWPELIAGFLQS